MKPLYLMPAGAIRVVLDGPSLLVEEDGVAGRRYPLSRLSMIYLSEAVSVASPVLHACLRRGIPVVFADGDGSAAAIAVPVKGRAVAVGEQVETFLTRGDWRSRYEDWRRAVERREVTTMLRRLRLRLADLRPNAVLERVRTLVSSYLGASGAAECEQWLLTMSAGVVGQLAAEADLPLQSIGAVGFPLVDDLAKLLRWQLLADWAQLLMRGAVGGGLARVELRARCTAVFESVRVREERRARALLEHFRLWLANQQ